ncbi:MAG TPA: type II toxin-antitoxin system VapC family toxin [Gemmatimonadaceae bacterium]|nr:type II toxin-antitoxin system VapC family toxin [Gemmatimonadaceae bacterium]
MRVLLDTHVWLWMLLEPERLSRRAHALIASEDTELLLSAVSAWEIAIKQALGKLRLDAPAAERVPVWMWETRVTPLPVLHRHALQVASLPPRHRDPFDRLLAAQAQVEDVPIMTVDRIFARYDVKVVRA